MLAPTDRRSITGRWNTMARRLPSVWSWLPHVTRPRLGGTRPMARRISVLLPEPLGPIRTVGAPPRNATDICATIGTWPASSETLSRTMGNSFDGARMVSPRLDFADAPHTPRGRIDDYDQGDEDEAEPQGEGKIALRGFKRDRGRHRAGEAVNIAADDHHRSDLRRGAPEAGQQRRHQTEASVPQQGRHARQRSDAHGGQFFAVLGPKILDRLAGERRDDRHDQQRLRDDHGLRRKHDTEKAERAGARKQEKYGEPDDDR